MHEGHRSRLVGKIRDGSMIYEHELLEILLFNSCPRRDLNATAHALINRFGSIGGVLSASETELCTVDGVGRSIAQYLVCTGKALNCGTNCASFAEISNTSEFKQFLTTRHTIGNPIELCLMDKDGRLRRICSFDYEEDSADASALLSENNILKCISVYRPYGLFVAAYRENSDIKPTYRDDAIAGMINAVAKLCGVNFYDFCIAGADGGIYSYYVADRMMFGASGESHGV